MRSRTWLRASELKENSRIYLVEFLLVSVAVIWGTNFSLIKVLYNYFHPLAFNAIRMTIATLTMLAILRMRGVQLRVGRRDLPALIGLGIVSSTGYQVLFVLGLARTRAGNVGLLLALTPVFAYLVGLGLKQERFSRKVLAGIVLSTMGVAAIVLFGSSEVSFAGTWRGDLMIIGAAFCWGFYTGASTSLLARYGTLEVTVLAMIFGVSVLVPVAGPWLLQQQWTGIPLWAWAGVVASAWFAIVYSYFVWSYAIQTIGVARTAVVGNLTPIVALAAAWVWLGERPGIGQAVSIILIFLGILLVRSGKSVPIMVTEESG